MLRNSSNFICIKFWKKVLNLVYSLGIQILNNYIEHLRDDVEHLLKIKKLKINDRVEYHESYIIANNWLTDLYGILHNNGYSSSDEDCVKFNKQIDGLKDDMKIRENHRISGAPRPFDTHLDFLLAKHMCKVNTCTYIY